MRKICSYVKWDAKLAMAVSVVSLMAVATSAQTLISPRQIRPLSPPKPVPSVTRYRSIDVAVSLPVAACASYKMPIVYKPEPTEAILYGKSIGRIPATYKAGYVEVCNKTGKKLEGFSVIEVIWR